MPDVIIKIIQTGDIHGCFFSYDFIKRKEATACLSRISSYIAGERQKLGDNLILLDLGDILQGHPTCYYSSFVNRSHTCLAARVLNHLGYDAVCIGNHDIETGHAVYDKWIAETQAPILSANYIRKKDNKPYFKPYTIIIRDGIRIAVLGITTTAIPYWLSSSLWHGISLENPIESARRWINTIREEEPDLIVGLFHTGWTGGINDGDMIENASRAIAEEVDGFDIIFFGHDHKSCKKWIRNREGREVLCLNASSDAIQFNEVEVTFSSDEKNSSVKHKWCKELIQERQLFSENYPVNSDFEKLFKIDINEAKALLDERIANIDIPLRTRDCFFGAAPLSSLIHKVQLEATDAEISFAAPLAFDEKIGPGDVRIADIFNIYKYENSIFVLKMTGKEIKRYLEYSYDLWIETMSSPSDHIMKMMTYEYEGKSFTFFKNLVYNFETAAGINYTVDVTKNYGNRINIRSLSSGKSFRFDTYYLVAMHSYRGNGGNEFLLKGAGIPIEQLKLRKVAESKEGERNYLIKEFRKELVPNDISSTANWHFVPFEWTRAAIERDKRLLFPDESSE